MNGIQMPQEEKKDENWLFDSRTSAAFSSEQQDQLVAPDYEIPDAQSQQPFLSEEEQKELIEKRQLVKIEAHKRQARFSNRKSFDELL